ncbi:MAG: hypothetical protein ACJ76H_11960 [Bacteriovoracaceae bacterium]
MKKTMLFVFIVLMLISCGRAHAKSISADFDVRTTLIGFTQKQEDKLNAASKLIRKIVRSKDFKEKVLNHTWEGKKTFAENDGLTNEQVYKKILEGAEKMTDLGPNSTMDLEIELYTDLDSITIGYTYPDISKIYMNRKYYNKFRPFEVADNMMHEWLHKIGFNHAVKPTPERPFSVPYAVGYIVKGIARQMHQEKLLKNLIAEQK